MSELGKFDVSLTLCFTPAHLGLEEHPTSPTPADSTIEAKKVSFKEADLKICRSKSADYW